MQSAFQPRPRSDWPRQCSRDPPTVCRRHLVDILRRQLAVRLQRGVAMHLEQRQTQLVRIFQHALVAAVAPLHHLLGAVEGAIEQHQLKPLVSRPDRLEPAGAKRRVALSPAIGDGHRNAAAPARLGNVARLRQCAEERSRLGFRPIACGSPCAVAASLPPPAPVSILPHARTPKEKGPHLRRGRPVLSPSKGPNRSSSLFLWCTETA